MLHFMVHDSTNRNTLMSQDMCISVTESRPQQPMLFWTNIKKSGAKFLYNAVKDRYHPKMIFQVIAAKSGSTSYKIMGVLNFSQDCKDSYKTFFPHMTVTSFVETCRPCKPKTKTKAFPVSIYTKIITYRVHK